LEDLEKHFGADVCGWYEGSESSRGVDNHYLVLAIKSVNGSGENAVAISPLTGQHATYVVRRECTDADWADIFASPKIEARVRGARRLLFATPDRRTDKYNAMRDKVITLLECDRAIVNTCGSRSLRGLRSGRSVGAFDEFAVLECCAGTNECDQVRRVDGAPA
jgi:hypothetical protein